MRVLSDGRVRRTEAEWRSILSRYESSGQSETVFCRRSKLARGTFVKWKRRLSQEPSPKPAFVEWLAPVARPQAPGPGASEFELVLPGGVVLRWKA